MVYKTNMTMHTPIRLKKGEDRRIRTGHPWIFSNEINTRETPLKSFKSGEEVLVLAHDGTPLGVGYINPHSLITVRLYSEHREVKLNHAFFLAKLKAALQLRERLFTKPYYRLVFSEADGLPGLVVDRFDEHLVVQINTAGMDAHTETIKTALTTLLTNTNSVLLRNDSAIREQEGLKRFVKPLLGEPPQLVDLIENDVHFRAPLISGQKTGWFYDHRNNRARLKSYVINQTVLDVFSYLGGFGVQAASFGATHVDCIDASAAATAMIEENARLNGVADKVTTICDDAFDALKNLLQQGKQYEVIILDPPAFVKRSKDKEAGMIAYQRINEAAIKLLAPNGILVSCSCSMHVDMETLTAIIQRAARRANASMQLIERGHQGTDHPIHLAIPETDYLKAIFLRKLSMK